MDSRAWHWGSAAKGTPTPSFEYTNYDLRWCLWNNVDCCCGAIAESQFKYRELSLITKPLFLWYILSYISSDTFNPHPKESTALREFHILLTVLQLQLLLPCLCLSPEAPPPSHRYMSCYITGRMHPAAALTLFSVYGVCDKSSACMEKGKKREHQVGGWSGVTGGFKKKGTG